MTAHDADPSHPRLPRDTGKPAIATEQRHKRLNNRAENSHRPVGKRKGAMQRLKSPEQAHQSVCDHLAVAHGRYIDLLMSAAIWRSRLQAARSVPGAGRRGADYGR